ncbi:ABC transporter permease [Tannockella kyphosi]|uniref:ABC transporter permease n=1 Tax=Tannockella kyphosi TaxID=2899121 RepID=UPI002010D780|nr:FtsX-like permease family protein [Tannockella kyphosi]
MLMKKLFRTMWIYKAQFISMIVMLSLGMGIFVGFNVEWYSIEQNTSLFMEETGYADYRIISTTGYLEEDVKKIEDLYGEEYVSRYVDFNATIESTSLTNKDTLTVTVTENENVSGFILSQGEPYDASDDEGIWIGEKYASENNIELGDTILFTYNGLEIEGIVKGLVQSGEFMISLQDDTQIMPDYTKHGYAYISPVLLESTFGVTYYPQIHVISSQEKEEFNLAVDKALGETSMILTKDESASYAGSQGEVEEGKIMGTILPAIFLLIATLTMVTTMVRITDKEKTQIGTLKALGFKNRKIVIHYILYAVIIGVIGAILGLLLGYAVGYFIFNPQGSMSTYLEMPYWDLYTPGFVLVVMVGVIVLLMLIAFLSVNKILKKSASEILIVTSSKTVKPTKLEQGKLFHKCSFGVRWNLRDMIHNKARTGMSILGVIGCMVIVLASLGMQDTMEYFVSNYYEGAMNYASRIYLSDDATEQDITDLMDTYQTDTSASVSVKIEDEAVSLDIYHIENDFVKFLSNEADYLELKDDGAYICTRIANEYELEIGDEITVSPYGDTQEYTMIVSGILSSVSKNIVICDEYAKQIGISYQIDSLYTDIDDISLQSGIKSIQTKEDIISSFDVFMEIMDTMIILLVGVGVILSIVVLYNLGVMSYTERYREMATLKVLGFKDKKISALLIGQNLWLSFVGIIIGVPLGYFVLDYLMDAMADEYETVVYIAGSTYAISILLSIGVTLFIALMISRKNKKIDMVEALKNSE